MSELAKTTKNAIAEIDENLLVDYLNGLNAHLTKPQQTQFLHIAKAFNLNPFKREVYAIPYKKKVKQGNRWVEETQLSIITGYEVYLKMANRCERLDGWSCKIHDWDKMKAQTIEKGNGNYSRQVQVWRGPAYAEITIHRKDWKVPFVHEVYFSEYTQDNTMWFEKPQTMLKKVAMAQGFRLAIPEELDGMPYTSDELPDNMTKLDPDLEINNEPAEKPADKNKGRSNSFSSASTSKSTRKKEPEATEAEIVEDAGPKTQQRGEAKSVDESPAKSDPESKVKAGDQGNDLQLGNHPLYAELRLELLACENPEEMIAMLKGFQKQHSVKIKEHDELRALCDAREHFMMDESLEDYCSSKDGVVYLRNLSQLF